MNLRSELYQVGVVFIATFGTLWGVLEALSYLGFSILNNSGFYGVIILSSLAMNTALIFFLLKNKLYYERNLISSNLINYPSIEDLADRLAYASTLDVMVAGGDSFYAHLSQALAINKENNINHNLKIRVLLRASSRASNRSIIRYKSLETQFNIKVDIKWYDWDFMLRGYCFDNKVVYFSFFIKDEIKMQGRTNGFAIFEKNKSLVDDFIFNMFTKTFHVFFLKEGASNMAQNEKFYIEE